MRVRYGISMVMVALLGAIATDPTASAQPMSRRHRSRLLGLVSLAALLSVPVFVSAQQFTLTINKAGTGTGTVAGKGSRVKCGSVCSSDIDAGKIVTLSAKPAKDSIFAGWSGNADCSDGIVTIDSAKTCTATFTTYSLAVNLSGNGTGSVTSKPKGIKCGTACTSNFKPGTAVTLIAKAAKASVFTGWTGACSGTGTCSLTMSANSSVGAMFNNPSLAAESVVDFIQADPPVITGGVSTLVTITATTSNTASFDKSTVRLWRYDDQGKPLANLGQMFDDGTQGDTASNDNTFTKQISLTEVGPSYVRLRVSANIAPDQSVFSSELMVPVTVIRQPIETRAVFATNLLNGEIASAYSRLGELFNNIRILDDTTTDFRVALADAASQCTTIMRAEVQEVCVGTAIVNGQPREFRFFLIKDVTGIWRIIGW
jgi:hypothetical protein